jgi:hypothetical protein
MDNNVLVILGMHRSGTSLIAQWLQKCGLHIGDELHGANIGNPEGHFEDVDFLRLHERILLFYNLSQVGMIDNAVYKIEERFQQEINNLVLDKNKKHKQWGWKDPRTCLFLNFYQDIIPGAKYFIVIRNYNEVVSSLILRDLKVWKTIYITNNNFKYRISKFLYRKIWNLARYKKNLNALFIKYAEQYLKVWVCYNEELLKHIQDINKENAIVCNVPILIRDSKNILSWLEHECFFDINYIDFNSIYKGELISEHTDITGFVKNRALIEKANALQLELYKHLFNPRSIPEHSYFSRCS